jgi:hypothetical protein
MGFSVMDSSMGGIKGCQNATSIITNVFANDFFFLLNGLGIKHNMDHGKNHGSL